MLSNNPNKSSKVTKIQANAVAPNTYISSWLTQFELCLGLSFSSTAIILFVPRYELLSTFSSQFSCLLIFIEYIELAEKGK
jgi:hypothetical protein